MRLTGTAIAVLGLCLAPAMAQNNRVESMDKMPIYRVNVVARTTKAINYRHRSGSTSEGWRVVHRVTPTSLQDDADSARGSYVNGAAGLVPRLPRSDPGPDLHSCNW